MANTKIQGYAQRGGNTVTTQGLVSTTQVEQSYPSATITVFDAGTTNLSTIYSDSAGTPKANPFSAATDGLWFFYAPLGNSYDVRFSGTGFTTFTLSDLVAPGLGSGSGSVTSVSAGAGLSGGPITTTGSLSVDQTYTFNWTGIQKFGNGSYNTSLIPTGVDTPSLEGFVRGTPSSGATSTSPALSFSSISNAAYVQGSGQFHFYGQRTNNSPMEVVSIQARQTSAITAGGGLVGQYIRMVNDILGDATSSHFAQAVSAQKFVTLDSDTICEFDIENLSGANAAFSYGSANNRSNGILIVGKNSGAAKKNTVALVIDADNTSSNFWTGIDIRNNAIDKTDVTNGFRAIVIPNGTSIYSRDGAGTGVVNLVGVNGANVLVWAAGGNLSQFSGNLQMAGPLYFFLGPMTFAQLGAPADGATVYCSDGKVTSGADNTVTNGGSGCLAVRINGVWRAFASQN